MRPPLPISYSRATSFEKCPARFKAENIDKAGMDKPKPDYMLVGILLHNVLDQYLKHLAKSGKSSDYHTYEALFERAWASGHEGIPSHQYDDLYNIMVNTREAMVFPNVREIIGSEIKVALTTDWEKTTWMARDIFVRMKIDLLQVDNDWVVTVTDYKTGHRIEDADGSLQLKLYAYAAYILLPKAKTVKVKLYYGRQDRWRGPIEVTREESRAGRKWIEDVSERIEACRANGDWKETPNLDCGTCAIFDKCPARARAGSSLPPITEQEAQSLLERLLLLEADRKDLQEKLKAWCSQRGALEVNGAVIDFSPQDKRSYQTRAVDLLARANGIDPLDILKADNEAIKKKARGNEELQAAFDAIAVDKPYSKLTIKRIN